MCTISLRKAAPYCAHPLCATSKPSGAEEPVCTTIVGVDTDLSRMGDHKNPRRSAAVTVYPAREPNGARPGQSCKSGASIECDGTQQVRRVEELQKSGLFKVELANVRLCVANGPTGAFRHVAGVCRVLLDTHDRIQMGGHSEPYSRGGIMV